MNKAIKTAILVICQLILATIVGWALLIVAYIIPTDRIDYNVERSATIIKEEDAYPILSKWFTSRLDNYTDSWMLLEAANPTQDLLKDSLFVHRGSIEDYDPATTLIKHYIDNVPYDGVVSYTRYWHGYLIFLKPLLTIFDYSTLRILNGILQLVLVIITILLLIRNGHKSYCFPYVISYLMLMPIALAKSFQFSSCFYVFTVACIAMLMISDERLEEKIILVFMYCGIATAFFDFLTYPMATFGVPMVLFLVLKTPASIKKALQELVCCGFFWCVGYGGMWSLKWVLASIVTGENVLADGTSKISFWMATSSPTGQDVYSIPYCVRSNFILFCTTPFAIVAALYVGYLIYKCTFKNRLSTGECLRTLFPFILVAMAPVAWYIFTPGHSTLHNWFTNKAVVVSVMAVMFGLETLASSTGKVISPDSHA